MVGKVGEALRFQVIVHALVLVIDTLLGIERYGLGEESLEDLTCADKVVGKMVLAHPPSFHQLTGKLQCPAGIKAACLHVGNVVANPVPENALVATVKGSVAGDVVRLVSKLFRVVVETLHVLNLQDVITCRLIFPVAVKESCLGLFVLIEQNTKILWVVIHQCMVVGQLGRNECC